MTKEIWLIASGEYSDYRVCAAAVSPEAAQRLTDALNDVHGVGGYFVDEAIPLVTSSAPIDIVDELTLWGTLSLGTDGTVTEVEVTNPERHSKQIRALSTAPRCEVRLSPIVDMADPSSPWMKQRARFTFNVAGTDHKRVRKVFSERRARYLSSAAEWPEMVDPHAQWSTTIEEA